MSLTDRISHFFNGYDDETEYDNYDNGSSQVRTESEGPQGNQKNRIMSIVGKNDHSQKKIMLFEPRVFSDAKQIASRLLNGQAAIINFERMIILTKTEIPSRNGKHGGWTTNNRAESLISYQG